MARPGFLQSHAARPSCPARQAGTEPEWRLAHV